MENSRFGHLAISVRRFLPSLKKKSVLDNSGLLEHFVAGLKSLEHFWRRHPAIPPHRFADLTYCWQAEWALGTNIIVKYCILCFSDLVRFVGFLEQTARLFSELGTSKETKETVRPTISEPGAPERSPPDQALDELPSNT